MASIIPTTASGPNKNATKCEEMFKALLVPNADGCIRLDSKDIVNLQKAGTFLVTQLQSVTSTLQTMTMSAKTQAEAAKLHATAALQQANTINTLTQECKKPSDAEKCALLQQQVSEFQRILDSMAIQLQFLHTQFCSNFYGKFGNPNHSCSPKRDEPCVGCLRKKCEKQLSVDTTWQQYLHDVQAPIQFELFLPRSARRQ